MEEIAKFRNFHSPTKSSCAVFPLDSFKGRLAWACAVTHETWAGVILPVCSWNALYTILPLLSWHCWELSVRVNGKSGKPWKTMRDLLCIYNVPFMLCVSKRKLATFVKLCNSEWLLQQLESLSDARNIAKVSVPVTRWRYVDPA